jgi:three-Cys-motif partner protein
MGKLVEGDDGQQVEEVGDWIEEKLFDVRTYVGLSHGARRKFLGLGKAGATYIDLFCGPGRARIRDNARYVDGMAVAAWKTAVAKGSPYSTVYIADKDERRRKLCAQRLKALGAPVAEILGTAADAAEKLRTVLHPQALHFALLDPYSLGALRFDILANLAAFQRMDILAHVSSMDLTRNIELQSTDLHEDNEFEEFAPAWREHIPVNLPRAERRAEVIRYWVWRVAMELGIEASESMHPIKNSKTLTLYWLVLLSRHELARKFWDATVRSRPQSTKEMF